MSAIEKPSQLKIGSKVNGNTISKIYFSNNELNFIIIKSEEDDNDVILLGNEQPPKIQHLLAECRFLITNLKLDKESKEMFDYQRAIALNTYMLGDIETSKKILESLLEKLYQRKVVVKKLWYIGIFLLVTLFMIFISMNFDDSKYIKYFKIATFGSIGGFISLNIKLEEIKFQMSESSISYILVSIYKVVFSMLASVISYFLIESDLILGIIKNDSSKNLYFIYAIATLAGFSESLLPNIFKSIENRTNKEVRRGKTK